jgi:putative two-component system response regulator
MADSCDPETGAHLQRVREYCRIIASDLAAHEEFRPEIDGEFTEAIYATSPLHDIGKVGIPYDILTKAGRLTDEEFEKMKEHTTIGAETLDSTLREFPEARFLEIARDIALSHHERWDGTGYPHGLSGIEIPLCGRIVAAADVYDACTSKRVYKAAMCHQEVRSIIIEGSGSHFDPSIVDAFIRTEEQIVTVRECLQSRSS